MSRGTIYEVDGKALRMVYTVGVMGDVNDKFGTVSDTLAAIDGDKKESVLNLCWLAARLAEEGELIRRDEGYDAEPIWTHSRLTRSVRPADYPQLKSAVVDAMVAGFARDITDGKDVDLGLMKLEKKKETE